MNAFMAVVGAMYLDQGLATAQFFLEVVLIPKLPQIVATKEYLEPKEYLQQLPRERWNITPRYGILQAEGLGHRKHFVAGVYIGDACIATGEGVRKSEAEGKAALHALEGRFGVLLKRRKEAEQ